MKTLKLLLFVVIMGAMTAGLITGMDALTKDRIAENANYEWKSTMLSHHEISFNITNYTALFEENFEMVEETENPRDAVYRHKELGTYTFFYTGGGLWGEINGILTLEADGRTIKNIDVLNQSETPGLGARVKDRDYLDTFIGKVFNEAGEIKLLTPDLNIENEDVVDKITGATGTSGRFNVLLNENYKEKMGSIVNIDLEEVAIYRWKSTILTHNNIEFTRTNYAEIFEAEFDKLLNTEVEKEDVFLHKTLKTYSYFYSGEGMWGEINGIITLEEDGKTIKMLTVLEESEIEGAGVKDRVYLDKFAGKVFDPKLSAVAGDGTPEHSVIDGLTGATTTTNNFAKILNDSYEVKMAGILDIDLEKQALYAWKSVLLLHQGIESTIDNFEELFDQNFQAVLSTENTKEDLYKHKTNNNYSFYFKGTGFAGEFDGIITLNDDGKTIKKITVLNQSERRGSVIGTDDYLDKYIGKVFDPVLVINRFELENDTNLIDDLTNATTTSTQFVKALNKTYEAKLKDVLTLDLEAIKDFEWKAMILAHHGIKSNFSNYTSLFESTFTKLLNKADAKDDLYQAADGTYSYYLLGQGFKGADIIGVITLESDGKTIKKLSIIQQSENRGKVIETIDFLNKYVGKVFDPILTLEASEGVLDHSIVDGIADASTTSKNFVDMLNDAYNEKMGGINQ